MRKEIKKLHPITLLAMEISRDNNRSYAELEDLVNKYLCNDIFIRDDLCLSPTVQQYLKNQIEVHRLAERERVNEMWFSNANKLSFPEFKRWIRNTVLDDSSLDERSNLYRKFLSAEDRKKLNKEYAIEYNKRPEVKEKMSLYQKEYSKRPEVKEKANKRYHERYHSDPDFRNMRKQRAKEAYHKKCQKK